uniref:Uncharacterized protein n=1 Tax=Hordeum vulgare subsp. vulgare TaxID=112509 RepID=A0A8I6XCQ5_HORVV
MMTRESWMEVLPLTAMGHYGRPRGWFAPPPRAWTADENKQFERALAGLDLRRPDSDKVAHAIGKTVVEVMDHFKSQELDVRQIEFAMVPFRGYGPGAGGGGAAAAFTLQWDGSGGHAGAGDFWHGYRFGGCGGGRRHGVRTPE